jgi:uncharacterized membrane protein
MKVHYNWMFGAALAVSVAAPAAAATYTSTPIMAPNAYRTYANGINDHGMVVGMFLLNGGGGTWHGFTYNVATKAYATYDTIPTCPYQCSGVLYSAINNNGVIAGYTADNGYEDFILHNGKYSLYLPKEISNYYVLSFGLNSTGTVVGYYTDSSSFVAGYSYTRAGVFKSFQVKGANTSIQGINDLGVMVGYDQPYYQAGFIYNGTTTISLVYPGSFNTTALGINNSDVVVGNYGGATGPRHGFMYSKGVYTAIPDAAPGVDNDATAINSAGVILMQTGTGVSYMLTPTGS